jgi:hypothetical protein
MEMAQQKILPFTKVPNVFFDEWLMKLPLVHLRVLGLVIRRSFGWQRKKSGPMTITEICKATRRQRSVILKALADLRRYRILNATRLSRQEAFEYEIICRQGELQPLRKVEPPEKQVQLPFLVPALEAERATRNESKFSFGQCLSFARASRRDIEFKNEFFERRGQKHKTRLGITNPEGWATVAWQTGRYDQLIEEWTKDPGVLDSARFLREQDGMRG